jgi:hypothetical protein
MWNLIPLLEELKDLQNIRAGAGCKEDAWEALEAINGLVDNIVHEFKLLTKELADGIPQDSNCPVCCEELDDHEEDCAFHLALTLLEK